ncbi:MAG TPA: SEC-C metal-binding domain-containing protein [Patescibacteria group bacterium]|nr:SEC-C metal-binding domain-containing protein [Patescibacteria group bacterium]
MADQTLYEKLGASCPCGSGKKYVECCGKEEMCPCGSGKKAIDCCFVSPETHEA